MTLPVSLGLLCITTGCLHLHQTVQLADDGSLTATLEYSIAERDLKLANTAASALRQWQENTEHENNLPWMFQRKAAEKYFSSQHLKIQQFDVYQKDQRHYAKVVCTAADGVKALKSGILGDFTLRKDTDYTRTLSLNLVQMASEEPPAATTPEEAHRKLRELLRGLQIQLTLQTPGRIISTTAPKRQGNACHWKFDPDTNPDFLNRLPTIQVEFEVAEKSAWN